MFFFLEHFIKMCFDFETSFSTTESLEDPLSVAATLYFNLLFLEF